MKISIRQCLMPLLAASFVFMAGTSGMAAVPTAVNYSAIPPTLTRQQPPLIMLALGVDHQLFMKAYSDYSDTNGDGSLDTTYDDSFSYYGYFDSGWCYNYNTGTGVFDPVSAATGANNHFCTSAGAEWSGNFLNWSTMTRMDVVRRVLYGGKRSTDTDTNTVLERAALPRDVHAFAKVLSANVTDLTPYSASTITLCNYSQYNSTTAKLVEGFSMMETPTNPVFEVAQDAFPRWAAGEVTQCVYDGGSNRPSAATQRLAATPLVVRVASCVATKDATTSTRCKPYSSASKPVGLLQTYGEGGQVRFGLMSRSYDKNTKGGVLRKNISKINGNTDAATDEVNASTGVFNSGVNGIIRNLEEFRIFGYDYVNSRYPDCGSPGITVDQFKTGAAGQTCINWGNPLGEIYLEALRYFAGASANAAFDANDSVLSTGLTKATWSDPLTTDTACANCAIIMLSAGLNSFDRDDLSTYTDINGISSTATGSPLTLDQKTNAIGTFEYGTFSGSYLSGGTDRICSPKTLSGLADATGICPEVPALEGGYHIAGMALQAKTGDLRTTTGWNGDQSVDTYAIEVAESLPSFTFTVGTGSITFLPACQASSDSTTWRNCSLADVQVLSITKDSGGNTTSGTLRFYWEDSYWGNDYDLDGAEDISFCIGAACGGGVSANQIRITHGTNYAAAGHSLRFGYTITGTSGKDGIIGTYTTADDGWVLRPGGQNFDCITSPATCVKPAAVNADKTFTYTAGASTAKLLKKPLWYAAKYGGFNDLDGSGMPGYDGSDLDTTPDTSDNREWDSKNNLTGAISSDGVPDNYFFANNPGQLEAQLGTVLDNIVKRTSAGTNAAVVANSSSGVGAVYQALYQPKLTKGNSVVEWGGMLHALFIDQKGNLREDSNSNAVLDNYATDKIVSIYYDDSVGETLVQRYTSTDGLTKTKSGSPVEISQLKKIWDARDRLSDIVDVNSQRTYTSSAQDGRYIFSFIDKDYDSVVDSGEIVDFTSSAFTDSTNAYYRYMRLSATDAGNTVNYVRGDTTIAGTRNRTIDYDNDGVSEKWRLGDIIHSTPAIVGRPNGPYYDYYGDSTYKTFRDKYYNRRQVIYAGGNDGMLHAFNGGFWDSDNERFVTSLNSETAHALGTELWAYVPMNLLPHLQWLRDPNFNHVYYVDGEPATYDVNIFPNDTTHPGGWGTILVVGMRLGGGEIRVDANGVAADNATDVDNPNHERIMRSSFMVFDVTDPESPPVLLFEGNRSDIGFTTSKPELVYMRVPTIDSGVGDNWSTPSKNAWYLAFGSGPTSLSTSTSSQNGRFFLFDLANRSYSLVSDLGVASSFIGDPYALDGDKDGITDRVYFGMIEGAASSAQGRLLRMVPNSTTISSSNYYTMIDSDQPFLAKPYAEFIGGSWWVFAGTGRLLDTDDNTNATQQTFYGLKEPTNSTGTLTNGTLTKASLIDMTSVKLKTDGTLVTSKVIGSTTVTNNAGLKEAIAGQPGWYVNLTKTGTTTPTGRSTRMPAKVFNLVLFTEYIPPADSCQIDGVSYLYAIDYRTGAASPSDSFSENDLTATTAYEVSNKQYLGFGLAASPVVHQGDDGSLTAVIATNRGELLTSKIYPDAVLAGRQSWRQIFDF